MKQKFLFSLLVMVGMMVPFGPAPAVLAQEQSPRIYLPAVIHPALSNAAQSNAAFDDASLAVQTGYGMIDVWVFVDADQNGIYSNGDTGLTDALVCINRGTRYSSCVGTDYGDTWWEDLVSGRYHARVDRTTLPPGHLLRSIRCEETGSRIEYRSCRYNVENWSTAVKLGRTTRLNIFFALEIED